jgi:hypothetical protein
MKTQRQNKVWDLTDQKIQLRAFVYPLEPALFYEPGEAFDTGYIFRAACYLPTAGRAFSCMRDV